MSIFTKQIINDDYKNTAKNTMLGQLRTIGQVRISGGIFNGSSLDTNFYTAVTGSGGTVGVGNSEATVGVTTTSGSAAGFYGNSLARYIGDSENYFISVTRTGDLGAANNTRQWGMGDIVPVVDGAFFQLSGTTFSIVIRRGGSDTVVNIGSFNVNNTPFLDYQTGIYSGTYDTNYHTYSVHLIHQRIQFTIDGVLVHDAVATSSVLVNKYHLRPFHNNFNTGVGSAVNLITSVQTISRDGASVSQPKTFYYSGTTPGVLQKIGPGALHSLHISNVNNNSNITLYDNTAASGTILYSTGAMPANSVPFDVKFDGNGGIPFNNGLELVISGATSNVAGLYE